MKEFSYLDNKPLSANKKETLKCVAKEMVISFKNILQKPKFRERLEKGQYKMLIGDDISGRLPTMFLRRIIKDIYNRQGYQDPVTHFIAGSGGLIMPDGLGITNIKKQRRGEIKKIEIEDFLRQKKDDYVLGDDGRVLIITDTIATGSSLLPLTQALQSLGISFDIVAVSLITSSDDKLLENVFGGNIFYGLGGDPDIYNSRIRKVLGLEKKPQDLFSHKNLIDVSVQTEVRSFLNQASDDVLSWYNENFVKNVGEEKRDQF
ncbi:MAG: phosphoribosyltransferase [Patescibacteria group bacterium]